MARYIDADKLCKELTDMARYQDPYKQSTILGVVGTIKNTRTADVVPIPAVGEHLEDLLVEFDEFGMQPTILVPDAEGMAIEWKRKLEYAISNIKADAAREIFGEIEKLHLHITNEFDLRRYEDLKKKYTEGQK